MDSWQNSEHFPFFHQNPMSGSKFIHISNSDRSLNWNLKSLYCDTEYRLKNPFHQKFKKWRRPTGRRAGATFVKFSSPNCPALSASNVVSTQSISLLAVLHKQGIFFVLSTHICILILWGRGANTEPLYIHRNKQYGQKGGGGHWKFSALKAACSNRC